MERKKPTNNREREVWKLGDLQSGRRHAGKNSHSLPKGIVFSWRVVVGWSEGVQWVLVWVFYIIQMLYEWILIRNSLVGKSWLGSAAVVDMEEVCCGEML